MSTIYTVIHYTAYITALIYLHRRIIVLQRVTLLHFSCFYYILTTLLFLPLLRDNEFAHLTDDIWRITFSAGAIFVSGCVLADRIFYRTRPRQTTATKEPTAAALVTYLLLFLFGVTGFFRYFYLGGAYLHFGDVLRFMRTGSGYYEAREFVASSMASEAGRGVAHAMGSLSAVFPVVIAISFMQFRRGRSPLYLFVALGAVVCGILIASVNMERAPMLYSLGVPVLLLVLWTNEADAESRLLRAMKWRRFLLLCSGGVLCGSMVYCFTDKTGFVTSLKTAFERIFVVPGLTSLFYYAAFPDPFPFRGIGRIFFIESAYSGNDVSTREIAKYATEYSTMNADSGFLPSAYTASGLVGCALVVVLYLSIVVFIDKLFERENGYARAMNLLVNACGIAALTEVPLGVALTVGGFALPSMFLYAFLRCCGAKEVSVCDLAKRRTPSEPGKKNRETS